MDNAFFAKLRQASVEILAVVLTVDLPSIIIAAQAALQLLAEKLST